MNWDQIEGKWKQVKGRAKEKWGKLTDDDLDIIAGKRDQLVGKVQEAYGISKAEASKAGSGKRSYDAFYSLGDSPVCSVLSYRVELGKLTEG